MIDETLRKQLQECDALPSLPSVALRIIDLGRNPNASLTDVERVLTNDPAIVARVLQVANSPLYGVRQCDSLREALLLIGVDGALALALALAVMQMQDDLQRTIEADCLDLGHYWRRSLLSALAGRVLGKTLRRHDCEQLFLVGLVQDIGLLLLARIRPEIYKIALGRTQQTHQQWVSAERAVLDDDHAKVGAWLLNFWGVPEHLTGAVAHSHDLGADNMSFLPPFERCAAFSGALADLYLDSELSTTLQSLPDHMSSLLGIDPDGLEQVLLDMGEQMREIEIIFETPLLDSNERESKIKQAKVAMTLRML